MDKPRSLCIFVIDDEPGICLALQEFLEELQHQIFIFSNAEEALQRLPYEKPDLVLMDIRLPGISGVEALREFQKLAPKLPLILMTAYGTIETALEAMKAGAFEYLLKPLPNLEKVEELIQQAYLRSHQTEFPPATALNTTSRIIGHSLKMQEVFKQIALAVSSSANVLIQGESGTGKELVARAIHDHSPVQKGPYCIVNCATLTSSLFENELYGHESGAYTGALRPKIGKVEMADQGTLFLDEIGEIPFEHQAKLLRFLETKTFERVGGTKSLSRRIKILKNSFKNKNFEKISFIV
jgi:DNA-binding NtrC family response regulator